MISKKLRKRNKVATAVTSGVIFGYLTNKFITKRRKNPLDSSVELYISPEQIAELDRLGAGHVAYDTPLGSVYVTIWDGDDD